jgi:hypothetical protein
MNRFDLEEAIMQAWQTEQDLKLFLEYYMDASEAMSEDEVANTVLGIEKIHSIRMSKLWQVYKQTFKLDEYSAEKCIERTKDGAEKCDEWLEDGFGSIWRKCNKEDCGKFVVRPGKVDCYNGACPERGMTT